VAWGYANAAFSASPVLGSCNSVRELASILLSVDVDQFSFPNEKGATTLFSRFSASQKDLQVKLDKLLFDYL